MSLSKRVAEYQEHLSTHYGPSGWWPGESPFEVAVGAILTQNTAWTNVERAIANLKKAGLLTPRAILKTGLEELQSALRPAGYFRVKAKRLRNFCGYLQENHRSSMQQMARTPIDTLRTELLAVNGIGPETADDILLYACDKPVFVVDEYTRRIFARHGLAPAGIGYEPLRRLIESRLPRDVDIYKNFHAHLVWVGKDHCKPTPKCETCPLRKRLPRNGPILD